MMIYSQRLIKPTSGNKYYIRKVNGGYSNAIEGKCKSTGKPDPQCNVLANCVGYAHGRFHEICGDKTMQYLCPTNAENFPEYASSKCKTGSKPKVGAVIVWQKGATLKGSDGAGHVAIVENIISDKEIIISQSGYNSTAFWTETCTYKNGTWTCSWMGSAYKFRCFIYNPGVSDDFRMLLSKGSKGIYVKDLQEKLNFVGDYGLVVDGSFGEASLKAVKDFQKKSGLTVDGSFGLNSWTALEKAVIANTKPEGVSDLNFLLDGKAVKAWSVNIAEQNYIRIADLETLGIVKSVKYNSTKKKVEVTTK